MSDRPIPYMSTQAGADLWKLRAENSEKYVRGDFADELSAPGATLELPVTGDLVALESLSSAKSELENALVVWRSLGRLTPRLAREDRIWTRLCHGECLDYSRARWLKSDQESALIKQISVHFFARTQTMCRDDNAIGRLWWSAFIASRADPNNVEEALSLILKTADIRSNFVERTWMTTRPSVASALLRAMRANDWVTANEENFRETMKALNIQGAGVAFEVLSHQQTDRIVEVAIDRAQSRS